MNECKDCYPTSFDLSADEEDGVVEVNIATVKIK